ncbi:MAG: ATP-binding protein [Deltaproteobacteria bacterium]|nr:ATP-binding protein [Deltaproteobacteria bacterium]
MMVDRRGKNICEPLQELINLPAVEVSEVPGSSWESILCLKNEKRVVEQQIVLPLTHPDIAKKHSISTPKGILLFGPPGTGKTAFARGTAGKLNWKFIEISPSALGGNSNKEAMDLKIIFDNLRQLERVVVFFDEFEELTLRPELATKEERHLSNEFLRQMPKLRGAKEIVLICATNNIRMLSPALLRPGRFDLILPLGSLDRESRRTIFEHHAQRLMIEEVDLESITEKTDGFTPADIEAVIDCVSHKAFEVEVGTGSEYRSTTEDFLLAVSMHHPTISKDEMKAFKEDSKSFCRADYCEPI